MKQEKVLSWEEFRYLNGARRDIYQMMLKNEEYLEAMLALGIVAVNGKVEKKIKKLCADMAELNVMLKFMVEKERAKDISLYLEDLLD